MFVLFCMDCASPSSLQFVTQTGNKVLFVYCILQDCFLLRSKSHFPVLSTQAIYQYCASMNCAVTGSTQVARFYIISGICCTEICCYYCLLFHVEMEPCDLFLVPEPKQTSRRNRIWCNQSCRWAMICDTLCYMQFLAVTPLLPYLALESV